MEIWGFAISFATCQPGNRSKYTYSEQVSIYIYIYIYIYIHVCSRRWPFRLLHARWSTTPSSSLAAWIKVLPVLTSSRVENYSLAAALYLQDLEISLSTCYIQGGPKTSTLFGFSWFRQWKKLNIGQYSMKLRCTKRSVPVFWGPPCIYSRSTRRYVAEMFAPAVGDDFFSTLIYAHCICAHLVRPDDDLSFV